MFGTISNCNMRIPFIFMIGLVAGENAEEFEFTGMLQINASSGGTKQNIEHVSSMADGNNNVFAESVIELEGGEVQSKSLLAKLANQTENYEDMINFLDDIFAVKKCNINPNVRALAGRAFTMVTRSDRADLKTIDSAAQKPQYSSFRVGIEGYAGLIKDRITETCEKIIDMVTKRISTSMHECESSENFAFFKKTQADQFRQVAVLHAGTAKGRTATQRAFILYTDAISSNLEPCSIIKLGIDINYSTFMFEVMRNHENAINHAKNSINDAVNEGCDAEGQKLVRTLRRKLKDFEP